MAIRSRLIALLAVSTVSSGCVTLSMTEEAQWGELLNEDIVDEPMDHKNVWAAGILDFLIPGVGHFYLGEWGSGGGLFLSNIFWPASPLWATPAAVYDTDTVNKRYTVEYYYFGPGQAVIAQKERDKVFQKAREYVTFQAQAGRTGLTRKEISDFLFLQDFKTHHIQDLDWYELEKRTGTALLEAPLPPPVSAARSEEVPTSTPSPEHRRQTDPPVPHDPDTRRDVQTPAPRTDPSSPRPVSTP